MEFISRSAWVLGIIAEVAAPCSDGKFPDLGPG
jgi:hypothetical protein